MQQNQGQISLTERKGLSFGADDVRHSWIDCRNVATHKTTAAGKTGGTNCGRSGYVPGLPIEQQTGSGKLGGKYGYPRLAGNPASPNRIKSALPRAR
jgi:hypothetical protein